MPKKEVPVCIRIHHITTFTGMIAGIYGLLCGKQKAGRKFGLFLFSVSQIWAAIKIVADIPRKTSRLQKSIDNIHRLCDNRQKARSILWMLTGGSILFKTGLPWMLSSYLKNTH